jgi:cytochrome c-type protein NapB
MNKPTFQSARIFRAAVLALCLAQSLLVSSTVQAADEFQPVKLQTLRGAEIQAADPEGEGTRFGRDTPPLPRDFVQQPPLIPHVIEGYTITRNFNKCLDCHAWSRAKESGATKISVTHFRGRDGLELSSVSPQRYFCSQCHVPQSDATPLVGNTFTPGTGMR